MAQDRPAPVKGVKLTTPPTIDGTVNDEEWKEANRFEGLRDSSDGSKAPVNGIFWIGYDEKYVYFAARLADPDPSSISANEYRTNVSLYNDDYVSLTIDPVGNDRDWCSFQMNPRGATNLYLPGGTAAKREWSGEFEAKGRITESGWEAEARIPWSIMRLPAAGPRTVNFNFARYHRKSSKYYVWAYTPSGSTSYNGKLTDVEIPKTTVERKLKLLPYGYIGGAEGEGLIMNSGLDMKMPLSREIQFVGTINPDFRNIENQILSLDFSRFERLAGESRPFFQEGINYLYSSLYASQRIKNVDAGASVFGRLTPRMTFGVLNTVHLDEREEHDLVTRFGLSTSARSSVSMAMTHLDRFDVNNNAYAFTGSQSFGTFYIYGSYGLSDDSDVGKGTNWSGSLSYYKDGLNLGTSYSAVSPRFTPRLGFFPETNLKGFSNYVSYYKNYTGGPVTYSSLYFNNSDFERFDGGEYRDSVSFGGSFAHRATDISAGASQYEATFLGQKDNLTSFSLNYPYSNSYRNLYVGYSTGKFAGEDYQDLSIGGRYRFNDRFTASLSSQFVKHFQDQEQHILSLNYDFRDDRTLSSRIVQRDDDINWYLSYRRAGAKGMEYYLIYGDPNSLKFRQSLILKLVFPLEILLGRH